jgi:hypothetical protein
MAHSAAARHAQHCGNQPLARLPLRADSKSAIALAHLEPGIKPDFTPAGGLCRINTN